MGGSIPLLLDNIAPAVQKARASHPGVADADLAPFATEENVWHSIEQLLTGSSKVAERVKSGSCTVIGAIYDIESGQVKWLGQHPNQAAFLEQEPSAGAGLGSS